VNEEKTMNQFQLSTPRAALAASAVALTAFVLGLSIVLPANLETDAQGLRAAAVVTVPLEPIFVIEQVARDGVEDAVVMRESSGDASPRATRIVAGSDEHPTTAAAAHCPLAKAKAAHSQAI
jgi:hypothetical protein